ncbi:MAG: choice-of-anchor D domain-containing protein, partial [bacterium]
MMAFWSFDKLIRHVVFLSLFLVRVVFLLFQLSPLQAQEGPNLKSLRDTPGEVLTTQSRIVPDSSRAASTPVASKDRAPHFSTTTAAATLSFTDITSSAATGGPAAKTGGHSATFADVDGDGLPDLYITMLFNTAMPDLFFHNLDGSTFSDEGAARGVDDFDGGSHGATFADLDNDGDFDLFNGTTNGHNANPAVNNLFRNDGNGFFTEVTAAAGIPARDWPTRGVIAFDMDRDGDLDLFCVTNYQGSNDPAGERNEIYRNDGNLQFTPVNSGALYTAPVGQGATDVDYDGDGDIDVWAGNRTGPVNILQNDGSGTFVLIDPATVGISERARDGITFGDIDNDGDLDMVFGSDPNGALYRNNGDGTFTFLQAFTGTEGYMGGFADLDNDGDLDLLFAGDNLCYLNDGTGTFTSGPALPTTGIGDPRAVGFADIDNDGDLDFAFGCKRSRNWLVRNDLTGGGNWLKVRLISPQGQAGAYGAKVYVYPAGQAGISQLGLRQARSNNGYLGQNDPVLHFGLGSHTAVDVVVDFLDGTRITQQNVPAGITLLIDVRSATKHVLTVENGTGGGSYASGTVVSLSADPPPANHTFDQWTGAVATIADVNSPNTTLVMPAANITVTATYRVQGGPLDRVGTQWGPVLEWQLDNPSFSGNPFDLVATATFVHSASGETITTGMYYDGANKWKFRFTGTKTGGWTFSTASVDPDLDGHTGAITINPNPDPASKGFVTHSGARWTWSGTGERFVPQLVMYWGPQGYHNNPLRIDDDIQTFFVEHGFNGFHTPVFCRWFDLDQPSSDNITVPNPDFRTFEALELLIKKVHAAGGMVHIWQWGDESRRQTPIKWGKNGVEDKRLQRYISARLGPLPGWTMGYGFDLDEWANQTDLEAWHDYMHQHLGWFHYLSGRDGFSNIGSTPFSQISELLDYASYEHHQPDYQRYLDVLQVRPNKPAFEEDRFRIRDPARAKDYSMAQIRRGLWHATMAGGVANIWGNLLGANAAANMGLAASAPFPNPEWVKTNSEFFKSRFLFDLVVDNLITDGVCLKDPANTHFLFYKESATTIGLNLSGMSGAQPAIAVDTKLPYAEINIGPLNAADQTWQPPYASDWAIAVGDFGTPPPAPQFVLNTGVVPAQGGVVSRSPDRVLYDENEPVTLTATANTGFVFANWSGDIGAANPADNPITVVMDANRTVTAHFSADGGGGTGQILFEENQSGRSAGLSTVTTAANLTARTGDLYLAAISSRPGVQAAAVSGLGLTWTRVQRQCSGRGVTGIEVWQASGPPASAGPVTATLASAVDNAVISVTRYSGADATNPVGSSVAVNTNGFAGGCSGGTDRNNYGFTINTTSPGAVVYAAAALRNKKHTAGAGYVERAEFHGGSGGSVAGVAIEDKTVASPASALVDGTFNKPVDWALVALEIRPASQTPAPDIGVTPPSFDFGNVTIGASTTQGFEVRNSGTAALQASSVSLQGSDVTEFSLASGSGFTLPAGASQSLEVTFQPASAGAKSANFQIASNDPDENLLVVPLTGNGVLPPAPEILVVPDSLDFAQVFVGATGVQSFEIRNVGTADLVVGAMNLVGTGAGDFAVVSGSGPFTLPPGSVQVVEVGFAPASVGSKNALLQITSNDADENPFGVVLAGAGLPPEPDIAVIPATVDFGEVVEGASTTQAVIVRNVGVANLDVTAVVVAGVAAGEFSLVSGGAPFVLQPDSIRTLTLAFSPTSPGAKTAELQMSSNDPDENPLAVFLSGMALAAVPDITVTPDFVDFGSVATGSSVSRMVTVRNDGVANLDISSLVLTGSHSGDFAVVGGTGGFILPPGASHDLELRFAPGSPGAKSATLHINSNDPDEPMVAVSLTGNGASLAAGEVTYEETRNGRSENSSTVSTLANLSAAAGDLYLAAISFRPKAEVISVTGLGLQWTRVGAQCSGRSVTGVEVWRALGTPAADGVVTATFSQAVTSAVISVSRYSGVDPAAPIGALISGNTNGAAGGCAGGTDSNVYEFTLTSSVDRSVVFGAVALRNKVHTAGADYTERGEIHAGSGGSVSGVAVQDRLVTPAGSVLFNGTLHRNVDWAVVSMELRPAGGGSASPEPDITVTPSSFDFGSVVTG